VAAEEAGRLLANALSQVASAPFKVLLSHAPPRGTRLDRGFAGMHVGSTAVREFVLSGSVGLCLCGHIHESPGEEILGGTMCVNLGPFKNGHCALIDITGGAARILWRK
jgi:hypothetical protein